MMLEIVKHIKTNIAQLTTWFSYESVAFMGKTKANLLFDTGLGDGTHTISPNGALNDAFESDVKTPWVSGDISTKPCLTQTFEFVNGSTSTNCYFGDDVVEHALMASKVNVGTAIDRGSALKVIEDDENDNMIMVYVISTENASRSDKRGTNQQIDHWVKYRIGVLVKLRTDKIESLGCTGADKVFISSIMGAKLETSTFLKFERVLDRFFVGKYSVHEYEFSYEDYLLNYDTIVDRIQAFNNPNLHVKTKIVKQ